MKRSLAITVLCTAVALVISDRTDLLYQVEC